MERRVIGELVEARTGCDERRLACDQDALRASEKERHVRENKAQRAHDRGQLLPPYVVELHPLLKDAAGREACAHELVELTAIEARRAGEPHARELDRDEIVRLCRDEEDVAAVIEL